MTDRQIAGWKLPPEERARLLEAIPARYPDVVADHVTLQSGTGVETPLPAETSGVIVGEIHDGEGVQAVIVEIGGSTRRPDGGTWHITWSLNLAAGRRANESNEVIARLGWRQLPTSLPIPLQPARWSSEGE